MTRRLDSISQRPSGPIDVQWIHAASTAQPADGAGPPFRLSARHSVHPWAVRSAYCLKTARAQLSQDGLQRLHRSILPLAATETARHSPRRQTPSSETFLCRGYNLLGRCQRKPSRMSHMTGLLRVQHSKVGKACCLISFLDEADEHSMSQAGQPVIVRTLPTRLTFSTAPPRLSLARKIHGVAWSFQYASPELSYADPCSPEGMGSIV